MIQIFIKISIKFDECTQHIQFKKITTKKHCDVCNQCISINASDEMQGLYIFLE